MSDSPSLPQTYVPLHCHSYFSLLDGLNSPEEMAERAKKIGCPAIGLTDHGTVAGLYQLSEACKKHGIKPILGMEAYLVDDMNARDKDETRYHLTIWAKNKIGYQNILALSTQANLVGFYNRPRIDMALLRRHAEGLIIGTGCPQSFVVKSIRMGKIDLSRKWLVDMRELFKDDLYVEIMGHIFFEEKQALQQEFKAAYREVYNLSQELGLTAIWTGDSHYCLPQEQEIHDIVLSIKSNNTIKNKKRFTFNSSDFYMKEPAEVYKRCRGGYEALAANTLKFLDKVEDNIIQPGVDLLPLFPVPAGCADNAEDLRRLLTQGIRQRNLHDKPEYQDRLKHEFEVIQKTGYTRYFLILHDFVNYARKNNVRVGPGRGSGVASLALYCLGVTALDPVKYKLMFSRFLNAERVSPPDVDIDFDHDYQEFMFKYLEQTYGVDNVARIGTYSGLKAKAALQRVTKVLDAGRDFELAGEEGGDWGNGKNSIELANKISKCVPEDPNITIDEALEQIQDLRDYEKQFPKIFNHARRLQGVLSQAGIHASGVVICREPIVKYSPLRMSKGAVCTQYDMHEVEHLGMLKFDILALKTLTMIELAMKLIKERTGKVFDLNSFQPDADPSVFQILREGKTEGIFQFEKPGITKLLQSMKVDRFEDMIASVAIYRPGPLGSKVHVDYCDYKHKVRKVEYLHPKLKDVLEDTFGLLVYQEDIIKVVKAMAGYSESQADMMRKAVGKKIPAIMERERKPFIEGCIKNGIDVSVAEKLFQRIAIFAEYGFNRAHAASYAHLAYQTAWLKRYYPQEFFAALVSTEEKDEKRQLYEAAAGMKHSIRFLPYNINKSKLDYTIEPEGIRRPLTSIKGVGDKAAADVVEKQPFANLHDFATRINATTVNLKVVESLAQARSMDMWGLRPDEIITAHTKAREHLSKQRKRDQLFGTSDGSLFDIPV